jgi:phage gp36-like protein
MPHPYHSRESVVAELPPEFLLEALDDDRDGIEDTGLYDAVAAAASEAVDAYLGARVPVPLATPSALASQASRVFALESLYARRGYSAKSDPPNPWHARATDLRARLARIAAGDEPYETDRSGPPVDTIVEPSRTTSRSGRMGA